jgi:tetratricopeptide (TPR) repeat protein
VNAIRERLRKIGILQILPLLVGFVGLSCNLYAQCDAQQASATFARGMKLAQQQHWSEARTALLSGAHMCSHQKRFPIELAGIAFEQKRYPEAARWLRKGLKLDPSDKYANNFAGTVYYLMGNLPAALKYWNRIGKPHIVSLNLDSSLKLRPLILGRAFAFSPSSRVTLRQFEATRARLTGLGIFPTYRISLNSRPDGSFDANFNALERDGFGSNRWSAAIATLGGIPYETIYPAYYNLRHSALNITSLLRWDDQKRRVWVSLSAPLHQLPQRRWSIALDARNENWAIRRSFTGTAPVLGSLNLQKQAFKFSLTDYVSGRFRWAAGSEISHRSYRNVQDGTALTPNLILPGTALEFLLSISGKPIDLPQRRLSVTTKVSTATGRIWSTPSHVFEKLQGSAKMRWFPSPNTNRWEVTQQLRGGGLLGATPFDQLFMLGIERDNSLWLRGNLGVRGGRKGSAPLGTRYLLANSDVYRRLFSNGLIEVQAGPLFDIGRMGAPTSGLADNQWLFDAGIEARVTVLGTRVILSWGRDLRTGHNAVFSTVQ